MLLLFDLSEFVLSVRVELSVSLGDVFNLRRLILETSLCLASELLDGVVVTLSLSVHDVLVMEILICSQKVFDVAKWDLTLTLDVTSNQFPNLSK